MIVPRDCPHGYLYRKRMEMCPECMEPEIDELRTRVDMLTRRRDEARDERDRLRDELRELRAFGIHTVANLVRIPAEWPPGQHERDMVDRETMIGIALKLKDAVDARRALTPSSTAPGHDTGGADK